MMSKILAAALLAVGAHAAIGVNRPRLHWIEDVDATDLFKPPTDILNVFDNWNGPLDPPLQKPQSYRVLYFPWTSPNSASTTTTPLNLVFANRLVLGFLTWDYKFEAPYLEVDPWKCADTAASQTGNCRCNADNAAQYAVAHTATANFNSATGTTASTNLTLEVPSWNYFPHAPFPGQHPFLRTYRKLCLRNSQDTMWMDTTVWISIKKKCSQTGSTDICTDTETKTGVSYTWNAVSPATVPATYTTLPDLTNIATGWECNKVGYLGALFTYNKAGIVPVTYAPGSTASSAYVPEQCWGETREMTLARYARTSCCGSRSVTTGVFETRGTALMGNCFNPAIESCCGWKTFNPKFEHCCAKWYSRINYKEQACKCVSDNSILDCQSYGANLLTVSTDLRGETDAVISTRGCCALSSSTTLGYPDLASMRKYGMCYDTTVAATKCCEDGHIYDPSVEQCCRINGVQSLDLPCPCSQDTHCPDFKACCLQEFPKSWGDAQLAPNKMQCDRYANWPVMSSPAEVQRCAGSCYDQRFQTCCNGQTCVREYEKCCNSTCCNKWTSACVMGSRPGTVGDGSRINPNDYLVPFELCTEKESFTSHRAFWVWGMPTFWLFASLAAFAIVIVVARRATEDEFEFTERGMVFFAVVLIFLGIPHFFSPSYKYGIVAVVVGLVTILGAVFQSRKLSFVVVLAVLLLVLSFVNPFQGNIFLSFTGGLAPTVDGPTSLAVPKAGENAFASSIFIFLARLDRNREECTGFYDYFNKDPLVHDMARMDNPEKPTFGFCTRAWMTTLLIFSAVSVCAMLILLMLAIFSFTKKLAEKELKDDIQFEVRPVAEYSY